MTAIKERLTREYQKLYDCKQRSLAREKKMPIRYLIGTADAFCTQLDISENGSLLGFRCCGLKWQRYSITTNRPNCFASA